jgi:hypothetical protein
VIVKMIVEKQMEFRLAGETEVLGENLPQRHFCPSQNPTWTDPGLNPGRRSGKPATNRLSYGAAVCWHSLCRLFGNLRVFIKPFLWTPIHTEAFRLFNYLENYKTHGTNAFGYRYFTFFATTSVKNSFRSDKYLHSGHARNTRRKGRRSSREMQVISCPL